MMLMDRRVVLLLLAFTAANAVVYARFGYIISLDNSLPSILSNVGFDGLYSWQGLAYSGALSFIWSMPTMLLYAAVQAVNALSGPSMAYAFYTWLPYFIGGVGLFALVYEFTAGFGRRIAYFSSTASTLLFISHYSISIGDQQVLAMLFPWFCLFLFKFCRELGSGKTSVADFSIAAICYSMLVGLDGITYLSQNLLFLLLLPILLLPFIRANARKCYLGYCSMLIALILVANATVFFNLSELSGNGISSYTGEASNTTLNWASYPLTISLISFIPTGSNTTFHPAIGNLFDAVDAIAILAITISAAYVVVDQHRKEDTTDLRRGFVFALLALFVVFTIIATTVFLPFGRVFEYLLHLIPDLLIFRLPYVSFHYILLFIVSVLFGVGSASLLHRRMGSLAKATAALLIFAVVVYYVAAYDLLQVVNSGSTGIPSYVFNVSDFINSQGTNYSVGVLPVARPFQKTSWYYGTNIYTSFIHVPVYTGGTSPFTSSLFFPPTLQYYYTIGNTIGEGNTSTASLSNYFSVLGIRYIVVQKDAEEPNATDPSNFNFSTIYGNLNTTGIRPFKEYSGAAIYLDENAVPMVYSATVEDIGNASISEAFSAIGNRTFNASDTAVYVQNVVAEPYSYSSRNTSISAVNPATLPKVAFSQVSPTKFSVTVYNASAPFYLVFRQTYSRYWMIRYWNGTFANSSGHIMVNGYANAWYINDMGSYKLVISFALQGVAYAARLVEILAYAVMMGLVIYPYAGKKLRHNAR